MTLENLKCPSCGGPMARRESQYGKFWGCKSYPKCKGTRDVNGMSKEERADAKADLEESDMSAPHHYGRWDGE